jgi:hypothetical protein
MKAHELSLFCKSQGPDSKGGKSRFVQKGELKALREKFPDLGYRRTLYVLHEGKLKSLLVKGASFGKFIDLTKELKGASSSSVALTLTTEKDKKGTVTFYKIVFTPGEKTDMTALNPVLKQLSEWFTQHDALQDANQKDRAEAAALERGDVPASGMTTTVTQTVVAPKADVFRDANGRVTELTAKKEERRVADELFPKGSEEKASITEEDLENAGL